MVSVKKRKGRVVIDSDSEDSASDDNLDQVRGARRRRSGSGGGRIEDGGGIYGGVSGERDTPREGRVSGAGEG